jgi:hypothetical protein
VEDGVVVRHFLLGVERNVSARDHLPDTTVRTANFRLSLIEITKQRGAL